MKEVLQAICDAMKGMKGVPHAMAVFKLQVDGSGRVTVDDGPGYVTKFSWVDLDQCVAQFRTRSLQAAKDRVVAAAAVCRVYVNAGGVHDRWDEFCAAVDHLQSLEDGHE